MRVYLKSNLMKGGQIAFIRLNSTLKSFAKLDMLISFKVLIRKCIFSSSLLLEVLYMIN